MEIICTPSNGLLALIVDIDRGVITREVAFPDEMKSPKIRPFGITRHGEGWIIASNDLIGFLDGDLAMKSVLRDLPQNIHQVQYDALSDRLWVAATSIDSLLAIDPATKAIERFDLLTDEWISFEAPGSDTEHYNSVRWTEDRLYVVAHKFSVTSSFVRTYDRQMERLVEWHAGREAHSVCRYGEEVLLLDSRGGAILGDRGTYIQVCETAHYARGMTITPDGRAVIAAFAFGARETRHTGNAYLRVYDLGRRRLLNEIRLNGAGNIQDIQVWEG